jgi:membrane fusion protein (multidrug efflux system)
VPETAWNVLRRPVVPAIVAALLSLAAAPGCRRSRVEAGASAPPQTRAAIVGLMTVKPRLIVDRITFPGSVHAAKTVRLAAEEGGKVEWIGVREGQQVDQGALVVRLSAAHKAAAVTLAQAELRLSAKDLERAEKLFKQGNISPAEYDKLVAQNEVAQARLDLARAELDKSRIASTVSGVVNAVPVEVGEYVNPGQMVAEILVLDQVEVHVDLPEKDVADVTPATETWAAFAMRGLTEPRVIAPEGVAVPPELAEFAGIVIRGRIAFISYTADPATRTFLVKLRLPNPEDRLRPGMIADAHFIKRRYPDAVVVPLFAVLARPGGRHVVFVEQDGKAVEREVALGVTQGRWVHVASGLEAGQRLITLGHTSLETGDDVRAAIVDGRRVEP